GLLVLCGIGSGVPAADDNPLKKAPPATAEKFTPEGIEFFEKKIRPILVDNCFKCHSAAADKIRGGLSMETRDSMRKGGDKGPAVVPGDLKKSLLIEAIHHANDRVKQMPPKEKLPDQVIADFETWVKMGAPDPRDGTKVVKNEIDIEKGRKFWAFQPPAKAEPPKVKAPPWARSDIDRFLLAALETKTLKPVGDADKRTLIRRVYHDLIGLPPSPEDVEAFVNDKAADAFEKVVDKLLASPQFGERW